MKNFWYDVYRKEKLNQNHIKGRLISVESKGSSIPKKEEGTRRKMS
jgi:hypothetical protein